MPCTLQGGIFKMNGRCKSLNFKLILSLSVNPDVHIIYFGHILSIDEINKIMLRTMILFTDGEILLFVYVP